MTRYRYEIQQTPIGLHVPAIYADGRHIHVGFMANSYIGYRAAREWAEDIVARLYARDELNEQDEPEAARIAAPWPIVYTEPPGRPNLVVLR